MFFSLALCCLLQNPTFHWDQEVDQSYWQALHLLEVDNDPVAAIELLEGLVDETSVIQYRGQASIIMAQTYRAQLRAGQKQSAATLLPFIRRESLGTEFYSQAEAIIADAQAYQNPAGELDPDFLNLVQNQLFGPQAQGKDVKALATAYGARLTPYLLYYLQPESKENYESNAFAIAVLTANETVLEDLGKRLSALDSQLIARLIKYAASLPELDSNAEDKLAQFLLKVIQTNKILPAKAAFEELLAISVGNKDVSNAINKILEPEEGPLLPLLLAEIEKSNLKCNPRIIIDRILKDDGEVSKQLREISFKAGNLDVVAGLAMEGDEISRFSLPLFLLPSNGGESSYSINSYEISFVPGASVANWGGEISWVDPIWIGKSELRNEEKKERFDSEGREVVESLLDSSNEDIQRLGLLTALRFKDWELATKFLNQMNPPSNLSAILYPNVHQSMYPYLASTINESKYGQLAAIQLMKGGVVLGDERMKAICQPPLFQVVNNYWSEIIKTEDGNRALSVLIAQEVPPMFVDLLLTLLAEKNPHVLGDYMELVVEGKVPIQSPTRFINRFAHDYGSYLEHQVEGTLTLSAQDSRVLKSFLLHLLSGDLVLGISRRNILVELGNTCQRISGDSTTLDPIFLSLMESKVVAGLLLSDFTKRFQWSPAMVQYVVKNYPDLISVKSCEDLWDFGSPGFIELVEHPDPLVVVKVLEKIWMHLSYSRKSIQSKQKTIWGLMDSPQTASMAAMVVSTYEINGGEGLVEQLISAWNMPDLELRYILMRVVGDIYDPKLLPIVLEGIEYPSKSVSKYASEALEKYTQVRKRRETLLAWQRAGKEGSPVDALVAKLSSGKLDVRIAAIESLGTLGAAEALPFLVDLMEDGNAKIAAAAASAVKKINSVGGESEEG